ncbi:heavy metal translocating P-type ATPase [Bacillus sp. S3]|uniref:heavy metal translocating P-type ATPase n=1 Tax=Bacillus sp. S3 TaxID=486398 RepID=UPI00168151E4|nr:cation-translocating P-type ATPase [Bacillus sp. S3]
MTRNRKGVIVILSGSLLAAAFLFYMIKIYVMKDAVLILSTLIAGYPIVKKAWQSVRMRASSIELLVTIAVAGALMIGEYVESAAVTFLFIFGAYLEAHTLEKTRRSLKSLMDMAPLKATVKREGKSVSIPAEEVKIGDLVLVPSGEKIAVDGIVVSGQALLNEAAITGESVPASKQKNDHVFSGTIVDSGYIEVIAERVGEDTTFAKIIELVEEAQESKAKTQKFLEKFANFYTPVILVLSVMVYFFTKDIELTLTFLVIACPGALVISAPVSIVAGIGNGANSGILIKGGEVMEKLSKIDVVLFDKTGTLTKGQPEVTAIQAYGMEEEELLTMAAEAEVISEHHLGKTIVREAKSRGIRLINRPDDVEVIKGHGIKATIKGKKVMIGNRKWMKENQIRISYDVESYAVGQEKKGNTAVFTAINNHIIGVISVADRIRAEAADTIQHLKQIGVKQIFMLTGDNLHTAKTVANQLGIDQVYAELLPEEKVEKVKQLQQQGFKIAMVGDGINDAPAIAMADIGIAMGGSGTDAVMETADMIIIADRLEKLIHGYKLAKATVSNMKQNMFFAVATVMILLAGVLSKNIFLASGMFIHEFSVLMVILNALRLVGYNKDKGRLYREEKQNESVSAPTA